MLKPSILHVKAKEVEEENWLFRSFLKGQDPEEVDEAVHYLHEKLFAQTDCTACFNCCKNLSPVFTKKELKRISSFLNLTEAQFVEQYLCQNENGEWLSKSRTCTFLTTKGCSIKEVMPETCRDYPHTHKLGFVARSTIMINNISICPVVYEIFAELKNKYTREFGDYLFFVS